MNEEIKFYESLTKSINSNKSSDTNKSKVKTKNNDLKHCQVYSEFIESHNIDDDFQIKKPKLNDQSFGTSKMQLVENQEQKEANISDSFIGVNSFNCDNFFAELANFGLLIVCLEGNSDFAKNNFSFKGRCSINLLCGCIQINGFKIDTTQDKWHDIFSPESNSYLTIINKQENNSNLSVPYPNILSKIQIICQTAIDSSIEEKIRDFLVRTNFNNHTSSLVVIRPLKSQLCNYICYFENFKNIYQTKIDSNELAKDNISMCNIMNKFGIFPIPDQYFHGIHLENENEKEVVREVLAESRENSEGNLSFSFFKIKKSYSAKIIKINSNNIYLTLILI